MVTTDHLCMQLVVRLLYLLLHYLATVVSYVYDPRLSMLVKDRLDLKHLQRRNNDLGLY